ncbi:hypothetical protein E2C01_046259 [Portunus trituberculatus]|uniref:Uncharacterized protein n=1 Tax=Portunus trituberculatus TaxID=210409 RepID=A0A5B7FXZ2_PORTR|nr:hypothetical protein [Portunus trituberculatus]
MAPSSPQNCKNYDKPLYIAPKARTQRSEHGKINLSARMRVEEQVIPASCVTSPRQGHAGALWSVTRARGKEGTRSDLSLTVTPLRIIVIITRVRGGSE